MYRAKCGYSHSLPSSQSLSLAMHLSHHANISLISHSLPPSFSPSSPGRNRQPFRMYYSRSLAVGSSASVPVLGVSDWRTSRAGGLSCWLMRYLVSMDGVTQSPVRPLVRLHLNCLCYCHSYGRALLFLYYIRLWQQ